MDMVGSDISRAWLMVEWSWRIEKESRILLGSFNDDSDLDGIADLLENSVICDAKVCREIPEIVISFANGLRLASFSTVTGDPEWSIHINGVTLHYESGRYVYEATPNE